MARKRRHNEKDIELLHYGILKARVAFTFVRDQFLYNSNSSFALDCISVALSLLDVLKKSYGNLLSLNSMLTRVYLHTEPNCQEIQGAITSVRLVFGSRQPFEAAAGTTVSSSKDFIYCLLSIRIQKAVKRILMFENLVLCNFVINKLFGRIDFRPMKARVSRSGGS